MTLLVTTPVPRTNTPEAAAPVTVKPSNREPPAIPERLTTENGNTHWPVPSMIVVVRLPLTIQSSARTLRFLLTPKNSAVLLMHSLYVPGNTRISSPETAIMNANWIVA